MCVSVCARVRGHANFKRLERTVLFRFLVLEVSGCWFHSYIHKYTRITPIDRNPLVILILYVCGCSIYSQWYATDLK